MGNLWRVGLAALALGLALAPTAWAQEYATETGELDVAIETTLTAQLSGQGYIGGSVVFVTLRLGDGSEEIELGTIDTDEAGRFVGEIVIPVELATESVTIAATGVTADGATRVLTAEISLVGEAAPDAQPMSTSSTSTSLSPTTTSAPSPEPPITDEVPADTDPAGLDQLLLSRVVAAAIVALGGVWWWLYRAVNR